MPSGRYNINELYEPVVTADNYKPVNLTPRSYLPKPEVNEYTPPKPQRLGYTARMLGNPLAAFQGKQYTIVKPKTVKLTTNNKDGRIPNPEVFGIQHTESLNMDLKGKPSYQMQVYSQQIQQYYEEYLGNMSDEEAREVSKRLFTTEQAYNPETGTITPRNVMRLDAEVPPQFKAAWQYIAYVNMAKGYQDTENYKKYLRQASAQTDYNDPTQVNSMGDVYRNSIFGKNSVLQSIDDIVQGIKDGDPFEVGKQIFQTLVNPGVQYMEYLNNVYLNPIKQRQALGLGLNILKDFSETMSIFAKPFYAMANPYFETMSPESENYFQSSLDPKIQLALIERYNVQELMSRDSELANMAREGAFGSQNSETLAKLKEDGMYEYYLQYEAELLDHKERLSKNDGERFLRGAIDNKNYDPNTGNIWGDIGLSLMLDPTLVTSAVGGVVKGAAKAGIRFTGRTMIDDMIVKGVLKEYDIGYTKELNRIIKDMGKDIMRPTDIRVQAIVDGSIKRLRDKKLISRTAEGASQEHLLEAALKTFIKNESLNKVYNVYKAGYYLGRGADKIDGALLKTVFAGPYFGYKGIKVGTKKFMLFKKNVINPHLKKYQTPDKPESVSVVHIYKIFDDIAEAAPIIASQCDTIADFLNSKISEDILNMFQIDAKITLSTLKSVAQQKYNDAVEISQAFDAAITKLTNGKYTNTEEYAHFLNVLNTELDGVIPGLKEVEEILTEGYPALKQDQYNKNISLFADLARNAISPQLGEAKSAWKNILTQAAKYKGNWNAVSPAAYDAFIEELRLLEQLTQYSLSKARDGLPQILTNDNSDIIMGLDRIFSEILHMTDNSVTAIIPVNSHMLSTTDAQVVQIENMFRKYDKFFANLKLVSDSEIILKEPVNVTDGPTEKLIQQNPGSVTEVLFKRRKATRSLKATASYLKMFKGDEQTRYSVSSIRRANESEYKEFDLDKLELKPLDQTVLLSDSPEDLNYFFDEVLIPDVLAIREVMEEELQKLAEQKTRLVKDSAGSVSGSVESSTLRGAQDPLSSETFSYMYDEVVDSIEALAQKIDPYEKVTTSEKISESDFVVSPSGQALPTEQFKPQTTVKKLKGRRALRSNRLLREAVAETLMLRETLETYADLLPRTIHALESSTGYDIIMSIIESSPKVRTEAIDDLMDVPFNADHTYVRFKQSSMTTVRRFTMNPKLREMLKEYSIGKGLWYKKIKEMTKDPTAIDVGGEAQEQYMLGRDIKQNLDQILSFYNLEEKLTEIFGNSEVAEDLLDVTIGFWNTPAMYFSNLYGESMNALINKFKFKRYAEHLVDSLSLDEYRLVLEDKNSDFWKAYPGQYNECKHLIKSYTEAGHMSALKDARIQMLMVRTRAANDAQGRAVYQINNEQSQLYDHLTKNQRKKIWFYDLETGSFNGDISQITTVGYTLWKPMKQETPTIKEIMEHCLDDTSAVERRVKYASDGPKPTFGSAVALFPHLEDDSEYAVQLWRKEYTTDNIDKVYTEEQLLKDFCRETGLMGDRVKMRKVCLVAHNSNGFDTGFLQSRVSNVLGEGPKSTLGETIIKKTYNSLEQMKPKDVRFTLETELELRKAISKYAEAFPDKMQQISNFQLIKHFKKMFPDLAKPLEESEKEMGARSGNLEETLVQKTFEDLVEKNQEINVVNKYYRSGIVENIKSFKITDLDDVTRKQILTKTQEKKYKALEAGRYSDPMYTLHRRRFDKIYQDYEMRRVLWEAQRVKEDIDGVTFKIDKLDSDSRKLLLDEGQNAEYEKLQEDYTEYKKLKKAGVFRKATIKEMDELLARKNAGEHLSYKETKRLEQLTVLNDRAVALGQKGFTEEKYLNKMEGYNKTYENFEKARTERAILDIEDFMKTNPNLMDLVNYGKPVRDMAYQIVYDAKAFNLYFKKHGATILEVHFGVENVWKLNKLLQEWEDMVDRHIRNIEPIKAHAENLRDGLIQMAKYLMDHPADEYDRILGNVRIPVDEASLFAMSRSFYDHFGAERFAGQVMVDPAQSHIAATFDQLFNVDRAFYESLITQRKTELIKPEKMLDRDDLRLGKTVADAAGLKERFDDINDAIDLTEGVMGKAYAIMAALQTNLVALRKYEALTHEERGLFLDVEKKLMNKKQEVQFHSMLDLFLEGHGVIDVQNNLKAHLLYEDTIKISRKGLDFELQGKVQNLIKAADGPNNGLVVGRTDNFYFIELARGNKVARNPNTHNLMIDGVDFERLVYPDIKLDYSGFKGKVDKKQRQRVRLDWQVEIPDTVTEYDFIDIGKVLDEAHGDLRVLSNGHSNGSMGRILTQKDIIEAEKYIPDSFKKNTRALNNRLVGSLWTGSRFEKSTLGVGEFRFGVYGRKNAGFQTSLISNHFALRAAASHAENEVLYVNMYFGKHEQLGIRAMFGNSSNEEIVKQLLAHPDYAVVSINTVKRKIKDPDSTIYSKIEQDGYEIYRHPITTEKDLLAAESAGAVIVPTFVYESSFQEINKMEISGPFLSKWARIVHAYKVGYLFTTGTWIRNYVDSTLKMIMDSDAGFDTFKYQVQALRKYLAYEQVLQDIYSMSSSKTIQTYNISQYYKMLRTDKKAIPLSEEEFKVMHGIITGFGNESDVLQKQFKKHQQEGRRASQIRDAEGNIVLNPTHPSQYFTVEELTEFHGRLEQGENTLTLEQLLELRELPPSQFIKKGTKVRAQYTETMNRILDAKIMEETPWTEQLNDGYNAIVDMMLTPISWTERIVRLSHYLAMEDQGYTANEIFNQISETHFNYMMKSDTMRAVELVMPFAFFEKNNTEFWLRSIDNNPTMLNAMEDIMGEMAWDFNETDTEDLKTNYTLQAAMLNGTIRLDALTGLTLKLNPSAMAALGWMYNTPNAVVDKMVTPIRQVMVDSLANYGGIISKIFDPNLFWSANPREEWWKSIINIQNVPIIGAAYTRIFQMAPKYKQRLEDAGAPGYQKMLAVVFASLFGAMSASPNMAQFESFDTFQNNLKSQGKIYDSNTGHVVDIEKLSEGGLNDFFFEGFQSGDKAYRARLFDELKDLMLLYKQKVWDANQQRFVPMADFRPGGLNKQYDLANGDWNELVEDQWKILGKVWDANQRSFVIPSEQIPGMLNTPGISWESLKYYRQSIFNEYWDANIGEFVDEQNYSGEWGLNKPDITWDELVYFKQLLHNEIWDPEAQEFVSAGSIVTPTGAMQRYQSGNFGGYDVRGVQKIPTVNVGSQRFAMHGKTLVAPTVPPSYQQHQPQESFYPTDSMKNIRRMQAQTNSLIRRLRYTQKVPIARLHMAGDQSTQARVNQIKYGFHVYR